MNELQEHAVTDEDSLTPIGRTLMQGDEPIDTTGLILETKLVAEDGTIIHDWTAAGVSWSDQDAAKVQYDFQADDIVAFQAAANLSSFWLWFRVLSAEGQSDTFPVDGRKLRIRVYKAE